MTPTFCHRCGDAVEDGCDLWEELAELDALLGRLKLKRYDLKRKINRFHSPIVRQLPPDVTSTIFEFCLPDFTNCQLSPFTREDLFSPLSLGAICSDWREIAWSTPSLWCSLVVRFPRNDSYIAIGIAQEWLARSGQLPLSIRIYATPFYRKAVSALADIINPYSSRWSELDLNMPQHYYKYFHATTPILKSVRFHNSDRDATNLNFQLTCPRLERANLWSFPVNGTNIHWDNLTHLTLSAMSITDSFLVLRKTPRLVFCKVSGFGLRHREPTQPSIGTPLVLTSLRSLQFKRHVDTSFTKYFLNNLIVPHLEEFSLPRYYSSSVEAITSFLRRSACSLRSFSMTFSTFPPYFEGFMGLLQSMPSLNTLSIISITTLMNTTHEEYDPRIILQLVAKVLSSQSTSLQQGFLPNLKILEYTGELYLRPEKYGDLYPLPPADNAVHGPLHLLKLDLYPTFRIPENMISYLSSLVERGVTVNVLSESEDILQSSIDYYRRRKDFSCQDWTDNLDSIDFCGVSQLEQ